MNQLYGAALEAQGLFKKHGWQHCLIGGLAVIRWGQPRFTQDVDFSLLTGFGAEEKFIDVLLRVFPGRMPDAKAFALQNRVLLCAASNGTSMDISLAAFPYEEKVISQASPFAFAPSVSLFTASAEDTVILKAFAGREKDWSDVRGILERQLPNLDWTYVVGELSNLCELKEDTQALDYLEKMRVQVKNLAP